MKNNKLRMLNNKNQKDILKNPNLISKLNKNELIELIGKVSKIIEKDKLLKIKSKKALVIGDLHGDFNSLISYYNLFLKKKYDKIIFLGDYIDRGSMQSEVINFLLLLKLLYKNKIILLRGNHETREVNFVYGFYSVLNDDFLYNKYNELFELLPLAVILNNKILLVHGGISSKINNINILNNKKEYGKIKNKQEFEELIWNDPDWSEKINGFKDSWRGSFVFGKDVFEKFMKKNKLKLLIRSHEVNDEIIEKGHNFCFNKKLLSIFSCSRYGNYFINKAVCEIINNNIIINNKKFLKV